jgi:hypothetical protein
VCFTKEKLIKIELYVLFCCNKCKN